VQPITNHELYASRNDFFSTYSLCAHRGLFLAKKNRDGMKGRWEKQGTWRAHILVLVISVAHGGAAPGAGSGRLAAFAPPAACRGHGLRRAGTALAGARASLASDSLPLVTLKIAVDSNGAVDDLGMTSKRFTSPESLDAVHRLRRDCDAVLVGVGTVVRDDPSLTVRRVEMQPGHAQPLRVVLDPTLRTPPSSALLKDGHRTAILCEEACPAAQFEASGLVEVIRVPRVPSNRRGSNGPGLTQIDASVRSLDLFEALKALGNRGISHLMVEGGPATARSFLLQGFVDRFRPEHLNIMSTTHHFTRQIGP
jgi:riboflavin-specific deaminase-like protein